MLKPAAQQVRVEGWSGVVERLGIGPQHLPIDLLGMIGYEGPLVWWRGFHGTRCAPLIADT